MLDFVLTRRVEELEDRFSKATLLTAEALKLVQELAAENIRVRKELADTVRRMEVEITRLQEEIYGLHRQR